MNAYLAGRAARQAARQPDKTARPPKSHEPFGGIQRVVFRDFKDTVYPFLESDTLFLECVFFLCCF